MNAPFRPVSLGPHTADFDFRPDGTVYVRGTLPLASYPRSLTAWLAQWAETAPDRAFLARRVRGGDWRRVRYGEAFAAVRAIGAALVARGLSAERPVAILSGNSIEHALLALGAMHVGVPVVPISVAYSLISSDYGKLRHIIDLVTPGLVFADDGARFGAAMRAVVPEDVELVCVDGEPTRSATAFADLLATPPEGADGPAARVGPDTVAKILFTSGSTGLPKGVINTQRMLCANQMQIRAGLPFLAERPPVLVDWTPWNHTFGGNHDVGLIVANGGTLYIDDGKPTPAGMGESIRNLREIAPTFYLNVPKGYEELVTYLAAEPELRRTFFSRLELLFYAGAGLAQHVWDALEEHAVATTGQRVAMLAGFGATETAPYCFLPEAEGARAGLIGLPGAGMEVKLVPSEEKLEARVRGPNVTPGYWRNPQATAAAFDEEGFYRLGDAMRFVDRARPEKGFAFDGRIGEDFKLATGTWVSVGPLRAKLVAGGAPYVRDAVIAGIDRDYIAALIVPDPACALDAPALAAHLRGMLARLAGEATGSSNRVLRAAVIDGPLDLDAGEVTDKGSLNQRAVLRRRAGLLAELYADDPPPHIIRIEDTP